MPNPLLQAGYEGESEESHAVRGAKNASASSRSGTASRVGWAYEAAEGWVKKRLELPAGYAVELCFFLFWLNFAVSHKKQPKVLSIQKLM